MERASGVYAAQLSEADSGLLNGRGQRPALAADENCRTWWSAADARPGQWLSVDLEKVCDIHAIQVNFADEALSVDYPESLYCHQSGGARYIEKEPQISCYTLEASTDGTTWQLLQEVSREGSNAYFPLPERVRARYVRLTGGALPYGADAAHQRSAYFWLRRRCCPGTGTGHRTPHRPHECIGAVAAAF